jgi:hypothetical protein
MTPSQIVYAVVAGLIVALGVWLARSQAVNGWRANRLRGLTDTNSVRTTEQGVRITGISIPMWDLVLLLVKVAIAAIPAAVVLTVIVAILWGLLTANGSGR